jgi:hypothetical protein
VAVVAIFAIGPRPGIGRDLPVPVVSFVFDRRMEGQR